MIALAHDDFRAVIAQARLAPSVHNVQPSRWRMRGAKIELLGDRSRSIPVADPASRDWRLSHGAAFEGLEIALSHRDLRLAYELAPPCDVSRHDGALLQLASATVVSGGTASPPPDVATRTSWRGRFLPVDSDTERGLDDLVATRPDLHLIRARNDIADAARLTDTAGLHFLRDPAHRRELLKWLRLSPRHPQFHRDGLNATAMHLNGIEAWGAGLVLGPLFGALDKLGVAPALTSDWAKTNTAAAIAVFHRPTGEDPFLSGRAFYRAWLAIEAVGLTGCPMSVLADWPEANAILHRQCKLGADRVIVNAFRIGRPETKRQPNHARLPVDELIV